MREFLEQIVEAFRALNERLAGAAREGAAPEPAAETPAGPSDAAVAEAFKEIGEPPPEPKESPPEKASDGGGGRAVAALQGEGPLAPGLERAAVEAADWLENTEERLRVLEESTAKDGEPEAEAEFSTPPADADEEPTASDLDIRAGPGIQARRIGKTLLVGLAEAVSGELLPDESTKGLWARLKTEVGGGEYTAIPLEDDAITPTGEDDLAGVKEVNDTEDIPTEEDGEGEGKVVWVSADLTNEPDEWRFVLTPGVPAATARYQVLCANEEDLKWRPDWVRAH
jgi:hypothetical protein